MKKFLLVAATLAAFATPAFADRYVNGIGYPDDATDAAIAADQAAKAAVRGSVVDCALIDTATGQCVLLLSPYAGG